jgi:hypothetical protein
VCACFWRVLEALFFLFLDFENFVKIQPQHAQKNNKREKRREKNFFGASKKYAQKEEKKRKRERKGTHTTRKQI